MSGAVHGSWLLRIGIYAAHRWGIDPEDVRSVERVRPCAVAFVPVGPRGEGEQTMARVKLEPYRWGDIQEAVEMRVGWEPESGTLLFCVNSVRRGRDEHGA